MTRNIFKNSKSKLILVLLMVGILCLSLFSVACNNDNTEESDIPSYSYVESNDGDISNPSFAYGTIDTTLTNFPKTSPTGWTRSKDTNEKIVQSSAKSGAVKVTEDGWNELMLTLYKDTYIRKYVERVEDITESEVKTLIKNDTAYNPDGDEDYKPTSDDIKKYYAEKYYSKLFENPSSRPGSEDNVVYMLNNYRTAANLGIGTSQKITSASEIVLNKGEYGKITVWIKTQNLLVSENDNYGANIRLTSKFNGTTQAEYAITNIRADEWTEYTLYVKADEHFETTVKLALGLGYDLNGITQGTVYFDDVTFTHLSAEQFNNEITRTDTTVKNGLINNFVYNGEDKIIINGSEMSTGTYFNDNYLLYDMTFTTYLQDNANNFFSAFDGSVSEDYTVSNTGKTGNPFADSNAVSSTENISGDAPYTGLTNATKIDVNKASYTLKYTSDDFTVDCEEYVYVSFYVKNQLSNFGSPAVTINVIDRLDNYTKVNAAVASASTASEEWQKIDLVIKNNFAADADYPVRYFDLEVVIGPADVATAKYSYEFATGSVIITSPIIARGTTTQNEDNDENADRLYDLYSLISGSASGSTALTAGYNSDYTDSSDTETYSLTTSPSDVGSIINYPTSVKGYQGIVANHFYVKEEVDGETVERDIDTRKKGNEDGVAGLINTKYLSNYARYIPSLDGLSNALNFVPTEDEENIQPIMIYNKTANHYGYVGTTNNISASAYAKVSVTLRVVGGASAYIYLVDVSNNSKSVLTFDYPTDGTSKELMLKVEEGAMSDNGWITVDFYVATGASAKNFRVEIWNGGRDGKTETASAGYVFIKDVVVTTSSAFTESTDKNNTFTVSGNPLYTEVKENGEALASTLLYTRKLTDLENQYNSEQSKSSDKVSYSENYVWAENSTMIYAIYNTIDPVEVDPYANEETDDGESSDGCTAETDPSTFWLSFSSILLAVALVIAVLMLIIKNVRRKRKANESDAKSHYTITSRTKKPAKKSKKVIKEQVEDESENDDVVEETEPVEEQVSDEEPESTEENGENKEETLDSYVYGDVEVFGENDKEEKND